jgi:hypothetical protein
MRFRKYPVLVALSLLAALPAAAQTEAPSAAEAAKPAASPVEDRIRALEEQVRGLQQQIEALRTEHAGMASAAGEHATDEHAGMATAGTAEKPDEAGGHDHAMGGPGLSLGNVTVSGMLEMQFTSAVGGSLKQPVFSNPKANSDFILTHVHPMIHANLSDKVSAMAMWCLTHVETTALYEAYLDIAPSDAVDIKAGRWLLPFGAWNPISNPTQFKSVSRPLMYLGHEERNIVLQGGPRPILNDEDSDIGVLLSGQREMGQGILSWAGYVSNGIQDLYGDYPDAWIDFRPSEDNNSTKSLGGRLAYNLHGITLGASYTGGKYDPANALTYRIWGVDGTWRAPSGFNLRAEYANNPYERGADVPKARRHGWYAMAEAPVAPRWTGVLMYSTLTERPAANVERVSRFTLGADYQMTPTTMIKTELGRLFLGRFVGDPATAPQGGHFDDVTTFKVSTVVSF